MMQAVGPMTNDEREIAETRASVDRVVIGRTCARLPRRCRSRAVRYVLSPATDPAALLADLTAELERLADVPARTGWKLTLLIHPQALVDFAEYNDFLEVAEDTVAELELDGIIQIASFHPHYQFAGTEPDDIENATNRSPWPTLHLIREDSIDRAVQAFPEAEAIYETNIETLRRLGPAGWAELQRQCRADAGALAKPDEGLPRRPG